MAKKINILVNLPKGFFKLKILTPYFEKLSKLGNIRKRSHDTPEQIEKDLIWADSVLMWSWPILDDNLLDKAKKLKFSANLGITQEGAKILLKRKIPISIGKRAWSPAVAEMGVTVILATLRRTSTYHCQMWKGKEKWIQNFPDGIDPDERQLTGRSVGIIGFGGIGQRLGELLKPFNCKLNIYDPYIPETIIKKFNAKKTTLLNLIKNSEIIVLSASSNKETRHLIGAKEINAIPKQGVFINICRAALVDTKALIKRLKKNDMYAAIDVFDNEPLEKNSELRKLPNVYLTPHRAGGILESVERIIKYMVDDTILFFKGKPRKFPLTEKMIPILDS